MGIHVRSLLQACTLVFALAIAESITAQSVPDSDNSEICTPLEEPRVENETIVFLSCVQAPKPSRPPEAAPPPAPATTPSRPKDAADDLFAGALSKTPEQLQAEQDAARSQIAASTTSYGGGYAGTAAASGDGGNSVFATGMGAILGGLVAGRTGNAQLGAAISSAFSGRDMSQTQAEMNQALAGTGASGSTASAALPSENFAAGLSGNCQSLGSQMTAAVQSGGPFGTSNAEGCRQYKHILAVTQTYIPQAQQCDASGQAASALRQYASQMQNYVQNPNGICAQASPFAGGNVRPRAITPPSSNTQAPSRPATQNCFTYPNGQVRCGAQ